MKAKKRLILACFVIMAGVFFGCANPAQGSYDEEMNNENNTIMLADELFEDEGSDEDGERHVRMYVNNPKYWSSKGNSVWTVWDEGEDMLSGGREVKMSKATGSSRAGYGIVICQGKRTHEGAERETMLVVMINNNEQYCIGKVIGNRYEEMEPWTIHTAIESGAGPENTLNVRYDTETKRYELKINESDDVITFQDETAPVHEGDGKNGYVVIIAPEDRFPEDHVDVHFWEKR